jgi:hypothetical protein
MSTDPGQAQEGCDVGEDADDVGAAFDLFVHPFERVRGPDLSPVPSGEHGEGQQVRLRVGEHRSDLRVGAAERLTSRNCFSMCSPSGCAKMVRMIGATISCDPFGTTAGTLRMKCTRQRRQPRQRWPGTRSGARPWPRNRWRPGTRRGSPARPGCGRGTGRLPRPNPRRSATLPTWRSRGQRRAL